jgi:hypothetical protein
MQRLLALIGIAAILLYLRIPQRIDWEALRGFKGADETYRRVEPLLREFNPKATRPNSEPIQPTGPDQSWMQSQCNPATIRPHTRMSKEEYRQHLTAKDLRGTDPLKSEVPPYCIHADGSQVFKLLRS